MAIRKANQDMELIHRCVNGSEEAWNELYNKYVSLVRSVVKRRLWFAPNDVEDLSQTVFASLIDSLGKYDGSVSLARFICVIAERACIQQYRKFTAAKRDAQTMNVESHDRTDEEAHVPKVEEDSPETLVEKSELAGMLKVSLRALDPDCRQLLKYRYYEELRFKEISVKMNASENTLTVRARRCLEALKGILHGRMGK